MNPDLAAALQALANQFNVKLAVVETPETPASDSETFEPVAPVVVPQASETPAELPAAPADSSTAA
jgi:hypothetical protein